MARLPSPGHCEQTCYRWRREYGGLKVEGGQRVKALEQEHTRLRGAVSDLTLDELILQEAVRAKPDPSPAMYQAYPERSAGVGTPCLWVIG
jgi:hypothetical protein